MANAAIMLISLPPSKRFSVPVNFTQTPHPPQAYGQVAFMDLAWACIALQDFIFLSSSKVFAVWFDLFLADGDLWCLAPACLEILWGEIHNPCC